MAVAIGDGEALSNHRHQVGNTVESVEIADVPVTRAGVEVDRKEWPPLGTTSWVGVLIAGLMVEYGVRLTGAAIGDSAYQIFQSSVRPSRNATFKILIGLIIFASVSEAANRSRPLSARPVRREEVP
jgi:hypothetical protein